MTIKKKKKKHTFDIKPEELKRSEEKRKKLKMKLK